MKIISKNLIIAMFAVIGIAFVSCEKNMDTTAPVSGVNELKATQNSDDGLVQTRTRSSNWIDTIQNSRMTLYKHISKSGWYVLKVNLGNGAIVKPFYSPKSGQGGSYATFYMKDLMTWRSQLNSKVIINASFFNGANGSIAHPLVHDGLLRSKGYQVSSYPNELRRSLYIFPDNRAQIIDTNPQYMSSNLFNLNYCANNNITVIGGFHYSHSSGVRPQSSIGRTMVGVKGTRTLYIVSTQNAKRDEAVQVLTNDFGCNSLNILMLDGGGSSGMYYNNKFLVKQTRPIPVGIEIN